MIFQQISKALLHAVTCGTLLGNQEIDEIWRQNQHNVISDEREDVEEQQNDLPADFGGHPTPNEVGAPTEPEHTVIQCHTMAAVGPSRIKVPTGKVSPKTGRNQQPNSSYNYRKHLPYHEKPIECHHCDQRFAIMKDFRRHFSAVHDTTNVFYCPVPNCGHLIDSGRENFFDRKDNCERNLRTIHDISKGRIAFEAPDGQRCVHWLRKIPDL